MECSSDLWRNNSAGILCSLDIWCTDALGTTLGQVQISVTLTYISRSYISEIYNVSGAFAINSGWFLREFIVTFNIQDHFEIKKTRRIVIDNCDRNFTVSEQMIQSHSCEVQCSCPPVMKESHITSFLMGYLSNECQPI